MLISNKTGIVNCDSFIKAYSDEDISIYINGILFCKKMKAGNESIFYIAKCFKEESRIPFSEIFGSYTVIIDIHAKKQIVFSDNSCMHGFYISDHYIGSNFIEIIKAEGSKQLDAIGVCEYFCLIRGGLSRHTYVEGICFSSNEEYYVIENGMRKKHSKGIGSIEDKSTFDDPYEFFADVMYALEDKKIVCALTGGFDSRAVASCMNKIKATECFVSGDDDRSSEIVLAIEAAKAGGYHMKHIRPHYPAIDNETIIDKWKTKGGYQISFGTADFRVDYFMNALTDEGYEILIDGSAGDMHKDFWFAQEFPFYGRDKSNPSRFYNKRMKQYPKIVGDRITANIEDMESLELKELQSLTRNNNTKSCLLYGWYNDWYCMAAKNTESMYPILYSPLQELEMVRYSYNISPKGKFMNLFLRELTSKANINVARVKTVYGTTASNEPLYLVRDFFFQLIRYGQQLMSYLSRKLTGKRLFISTVDNYLLDDEVKKNKIVNDAISWAKCNKYIKGKTELSEISMPLLDVILNLYLVEKYCLGNNE